MSKGRSSLIIYRSLLFGCTSFCPVTSVSYCICLKCIKYIYMCGSWGRKTIYPEFPHCWTGMLWNDALGTPEVGPILRWYKSSITPQRLIVPNCPLSLRLLSLSLWWGADTLLLVMWSVAGTIPHSFSSFWWLGSRLHSWPATASPFAVSNLAFVSYATNVVSLVSGFVQFSSDYRWYKLT